MKGTNAFLLAPVFWILDSAFLIPYIVHFPGGERTQSDTFASKFVDLEAVFNT